MDEKFPLEKGEFMSLENAMFMYLMEQCEAIT